MREDLALRVGEVRAAISRAIERECSPGRQQLPMDVGSLAAVIRALGLGLAAERLIDPEAIPANLFGDFVEILFDLCRAEGPRASPTTGAHPDSVIIPGHDIGAWSALARDYP